MNQNKQTTPIRAPALVLAAITATLLVAGCQTTGTGTSSQAPVSDPAMRAKAIAMIKGDFKARGIAGLERLDEDAVQALCNSTGNTPPAEAAQKLQVEMMAAIKLPADGLMGDWKEGEKLAQSGRGFTWTDQPGLPVGGNCYNCHQVSPKELSFGTVGPSLYQIGKRLGNTPASQEYIYKKIYNAKAFMLCSEMPRFGAIGALQEKQIKDLVALLLDPESPVNK